MKYFLIITLSLISYNCFSQKTVFTVNEERARFELHKYGTRILSKTFITINGATIDAALQQLIIDLMTEKKGFVSVEFVNNQELIVEYQEFLTDELLLKNISRNGKVFIEKPIAIPVDR